MKLTALLLGLLYSLNALSQNGKVTLYFNPLATIDFVNFPAIQVGIENKLSKRFSLYNEVGVRYTSYFFRKADTSFIPTSGFRFKTEVRYYFYQNHLLRDIFQRRVYEKPQAAPKSFHSYVGFNAFFINDHHNAESFYLNKDSVKSTDNYSVKKSVLGFNFLLGYQKPFGKRFTTDCYIGLGARFRFIKTQHKEIDYGKVLLLTPIDLNANTITEEPELQGGYSPAGNFTMGIRIGYRL